VVVVGGGATGAGLARDLAMRGLRPLLVEQSDLESDVYIVNRTHEHAVTLAKAAKASPLKHDQLAKQRFDVLINSTPCGMAGSAQALPLAENELNAGLVFDMVYNPLETPLLKLAKSRGLRIINGLEMFVQQGARQFEIWTGKTPPEAAMLRVVRRELRKRHERAIETWLREEVVAAHDANKADPSRTLSATQVRPRLASARRRSVKTVKR